MTLLKTEREENNNLIRPGLPTQRGTPEAPLKSKTQATHQVLKSRAMSKPKFNDDMYCENVEKWEDEIVPQRLIAKQVTWCFYLVPAVIVVGWSGAGTNWKRWIAIVAVAYILLMIFTFLEELNENLRFVRHQLRSFRSAVRQTHFELSKYDHPEAVTVAEAISVFDRHWDQP